MSLINDMLRDLDNRRKHEHRGKTFTEVPTAVMGKNPSNMRWWFMVAGVLGLGAAIWLIVSIFPQTLTDIPENMITVQDNQQFEAGSVQQSGKIDPAPQLPVDGQMETTSLAFASENSKAVNEVEVPVTKLLGMVVGESAKSATLLLSFSDLPEYRLEQNDRDESPSKLVISFSGVQLDDNLEIPELTGKLLERISLRPQQKRLQVLVDLGSQSEVGSSELKGNDDSGYTLQIDFKQISPLIAATADTPQVPEEVVVEPAKNVAAQSIKQVREESQISVQSDDTAHLSRSKNRLSPEKQAYQSGLEQMRKGKFAEAEHSFTTALKIDPTHVQARLQRIAALQQQNKMEQAQAQMREGLAQTPRSLQLRKIYARFLLSKQHNLEAIKVLRAQPFPSVAQDMEYHALLAALLQETRQFNAAAQVYANLLRLRPETALWWFGLAVSMDQAGDFKQARNAYRRALALPGLSKDVQKYAQSRLQVL